MIAARSTVPLTALAFALLAAACSLLVQSDRNQCATNSDCATLGANLTCVANTCTGILVDASADVSSDASQDPNAACLGLGIAGTPPVVVGRAYDATNPSTALAGTSIAVCNPADPDCAHPTGTFTSDSTGLVTINSPAPGAFWWVTRSSYFPEHVYWRRPTVPVGYTGTSGGFPADSILRMFTPDVFFILAQSVTPDYDKNLGFMLIQYSGCVEDAPVLGMTFEISPADSSIGYYVADGSPSPTLKSTDATSENAGGFANVPLGPVKVTVRGPDHAELVSTNINVASNRLTYVLVGPSRFPTDAGH